MMNINFISLTSHAENKTVNVDDSIIRPANLDENDIDILIKYTQNVINSDLFNMKDNINIALQTDGENLIFMLSDNMKYSIYYSIDIETRQPELTIVCQYQSIVTENNDEMFIGECSKFIDILEKYFMDRFIQSIYDRA